MATKTKNGTKRGTKSTKRTPRGRATQGAGGRVGTHGKGGTSSTGGSTGVNPSLTITALAEHAMSRVPAAGEAAAEPVARAVA